jgi:lactate dehydrogenase-like 2-hydroxyacid dehydrogenase
MTIVFLDARTVGPEPDLSQFHKLGTFVTYPETTLEQTAERLRGADVVITNKARITRDIIAACPDLKLICVAATGTNNVDMAAAQERGIPVKNVAGYSTDSVAQVTFGLLLSLLNSTHYYDRYVKSGAYSRETIFTHLARPFWELAGKRFGIIGLGAIGRQVAQVAVAFGCEVVYFSASGQTYPDVPYRAVSLPELLGTSDVVSVHAPLTEKTNNLLTYSELCLMKPTAILLGLSRGGMVNEADLARALDEGKLAGAGMDVFGQEPPAPNHPYLMMQHPDRLLLAPHIAWSSLEARQRLMDAVADNIRQP